MIWAYILQQQKGAASIERGKFGFSTLPVHCDQIQILSAKRGIDILRVQYLQHTPVGDADYGKPTVHIICSLVITKVPALPHQFTASDWANFDD
jgi:hypothetical protein